MSKIVINQIGTDSALNVVETEYTENVYAAAREYSTISRYKDILQIRDDENDYTYTHANLYKFNIPFSEKDTIMTADSNTRLDILADKYYHNSTFWWIIAMASNISDPFNIVPGQFIRIPPLKSLYDDLSIFTRR